MGYRESGNQTRSFIVDWLVHPLDASHRLVTHTHLGSSSRAVLHRSIEDGPNATEARIPLETLGDLSWWARFTDEDYENQTLENIRTSMSLGEVLLILGAAQDDDPAIATLHLAPGPYVVC